MVTLSAKNIKTPCPTKKFSERRLGPFRIIQVICKLAMKLQLSKNLSRIHPVFHVSLLEPVKEDHITNQSQPPPPPVKIEQELEWNVERILDSKSKAGQSKEVLYLVKWQGFNNYTLKRQSWEPWEIVVDAREFIQDYQSHNPTKPRSPQYKPTLTLQEERQRKEVIWKRRRTR